MLLINFTPMTYCDNVGFTTSDSHVNTQTHTHLHTAEMRGLNFHQISSTVSKSSISSYNYAIKSKTQTFQCLQRGWYTKSAKVFFFSISYPFAMHISEKTHILRDKVAII